MSVSTCRSNVQECPLPSLLQSILQALSFHWLTCCSSVSYSFFFFLISLPIHSLVSLFKKIYLFLAALGLRCCAWAFSSCSEWGLLFVAVCGLLSLRWLLLLQSRGSRCAGFSSCGIRALELRLSSCGTQASLLIACGIFPDRGSNPCPLHWQANS